MKFVHLVKIDFDAVPGWAGEVFRLPLKSLTTEHTEATAGVGSPAQAERQLHGPPALLRRKRVDLRLPLFAAAEDHRFDFIAGADVDRSREWWSLSFNYARESGGRKEAHVPEFDRMPVGKWRGQVGD
jgi:hypothetical protein